MNVRQPLPTLWMMTDERQGDALLPAIARLPRGAGVVFRHYRTAERERRRLFDRVRRVARRRGLLLILAGEAACARKWSADGSHGRPRRRAHALRTSPAHSLTAIRAAERAGAAAVFLSPVHDTRSHPGQPALGRLRFALLARQARIPVIALGGMNARRARALPHIHGWAAIDAWSTQQPLRGSVAGEGESPQASV